MRRNDVFLLLAVLALSGALFFALRANSGPAGIARVYHEGDEIAELSLSGPGEFRWEDGDDYVLVRVEDGRARVTEASCPDKLCVNTGAVSRAGAAIVCLPNRVSVVLEKPGDAEQLDAIAY
ncbi:MAG: NusG domain II-containing protein [Clostridiales bacterium]|jgi:hypothetical protein|nr:NusG domain II-containing protein [Clostridiales bacterium]